MLQGCSTTQAAGADEHFTISNGELMRPTGYREWVFVGAPVTPNDLNNGKATIPHRTMQACLPRQLHSRRNPVMPVTRPVQPMTLYLSSTIQCCALVKGRVKRRLAA